MVVTYKKLLYFVFNTLSSTSEHRAWLKIHVKIIARDKVYEFSEIEPHGKPKKIVFILILTENQK